MLSVSISAMSVCACLLSQICPWDLKFRLNFFRPDARRWCDFVGLFVTALSICTESSFWWTQIIARVVGQMRHNYPHSTLFTPSESVTDLKQLSITDVEIPVAC
jgi:hypothetical protein